ncbi:MAG: SAV_6107 family HEPN domain-containing protein [Actinomycetota bacterium]
MTTADRAATPSPPVTRSALALFAQGRRALFEAYQASSSAERFRLAHLAALRAAAAVSARAIPPPGSRRQLQSVWSLVASAAPDLATWAAYFAAGAADRAAVEAGATSAVSHGDADDQLRAADAFLDIVEATLMPAWPALAS